MIGFARATAAKSGFAVTTDAASPARSASIGNQATLRRLARNGAAQEANAGPSEPTRSGLVIGDHDDPLERDADQVADRVMQAQPPAFDPAAGGQQISRKCSACEDDERPKLRAKSADAAGGGEAAPNAVRQVLSSPGRALEPTVRDFFEPRFESDFGDVRLHVDSQAGDSARQIGALAYAAGEHVVVDPAHYRPHTDAGRRLLAHELTHVVQQRGGGHRQSK